MADQQYGSTMSEASGAQSGRSTGDGHPETEFRQTAERVKDSLASTGEQIKEEAKQRVQSMFSDQKHRAASELDSVADALRQSGRRLREQEREAVAHYAERAADRVERLSQAVRDKDVGQWVGDVEAFARRQPGLFLAGAFAAGFLVARIIKGSTTAASSDFREQSAPERGDYDEEVFVGEGMPYAS